MLKQDIEKYDNYICISLNGRIDGMTTPELDKLFLEQINSGERKFLVNLKDVHYISSVGLRVFLKFQKQLSRVSGELILQNPCEDVLQVFNLSGFTKLFKFVEGDENPFSSEAGGADLVTDTYNILKISSKLFDTTRGVIQKSGSTKKLSQAEYEESDIYAVKSESARFGLGLAALGSDFKSYSKYFGEAMVIDHSCLVYPAVPNANADMMLGGSHPYNFLNGFSFSGEFSSINLLESAEFISLEEIVAYVQEKSPSALTGVVFMAESKGLWGMNLKKVPLKESNPSGDQIMSEENFARWFNFSIEPENIDELVIGCGVIKKQDASLPENLKELVSGDYHLHGAVFPGAILNKTHSEFTDELKSILFEYDCSKVQHLLKKSKFSSVMLGLIPLEIKGE